MKNIQYNILTANSVSSLVSKVKEAQQDGWIPKGSHKIVEVHHQMRYSGMQHKDTNIQSEYSQTMIKPEFEEEIIDKTQHQ